MNETRVVDRGEPSTGLQQHLDRRPPRTLRVVGHPRAQRSALDQLHGQEDSAFEGACVIDVDDVGMAHLREGLRLP